MLTAATQPIALPRWVIGVLLLACAEIIVIGSVAFWAFLTANSVTQIEPFTAERRAEILEDQPGGTFVNAGTYRRCVNGQVWFYYADGLQGTYGRGCWR